MFVKLLIKKIFKYLSYLTISLLILFVLMIQISPALPKPKAISPIVINVAKNNIKNVMDKLASHLTFVEFTFSNEQLDAISQLITHLLPSSRAQIVTTEIGVVIATTTQVDFIGNWYLNTSCWLTKDSAETVFDECRIGNIPLPGFLVKNTMLGAVSMVFGTDVSSTAEKLIANAEYSKNKLVLTAKKAKFLRDDVNNSLNKIGSLATAYTQSSTVSREVVQLYVEHVEAIEAENLHEYISSLAAFAQRRTKDNNSVDENTAILWSLAIVFGDYRFASLIGVPRNKSNITTPKLRGRTDLTLHFIYSAILQQLGDIDIALSIGETKELLDSLKGGSGYSFADLAADKSGLIFAKFITGNEKSAELAQEKLKDMKIEDIFFPYTHDLPEGFRDNNFKRVIKSTDSENYKIIENEIDLRIGLLPLYSSQNLDKFQENWRTSSVKAFKSWFKIDTHIHSIFSDGNATIEQIAEKASLYGCDAIAVTDHGDHNLPKVLSNEYFTTIENVQKNHPYMTIIPGLEWNIPPFNGREHVTVLLPKSDNLQRNLSAFRERYDQFNRFDEKVLSPASALKWLEKYGADNTQVSPVLIYNHPSRKNFQQQENEHDFIYWHEYSDLIIGFSGAPGHQKKRGINNGSYEKHLRTINGWDPSIENIGGEWDRLLQKGYKIWAARAASDFHNTEMDYWPCQFSSTHVNAKSNHQNDILLALREGVYWAQHGDFIRNLNFKLKTNKEELSMGQQGVVLSGSSIKIDLNIRLNKQDWQQNQASLDELELIVITDKDIRTIEFNDQLMPENINISHEYKVNSPFVIFRWRGKSLQSGLHDYMFYTNPIKVSLEKFYE